MNAYRCFLPLAAFYLALPGAGLEARTALIIALKIDSTQFKDYQSIREFYWESLSAVYPGSLKAAEGDSVNCSDRECARVLAKSLGADEAIFGAVRSLGRKLYFSSTIIGADGSEAFTQQIGIADVEDFEIATRRMAQAIVNRQTAEAVADVDNITGKEEDLEVNRRRHFYSMGASLGYAIPMGDSYQRWKLNDDCDDFLMSCPPDSVHLQEYSQIIKLGWNNWFEFKNRLAMEIDVIWYAPIAIGTDVNLEYFFANSDITPFAGGGLGLHYVFADEGARRNSNKTNSGPTFNAQAGLIFFRTYNLNLVVRGQYHLIVNEDRDNGPSVDVALRTKVGGSGGGSGGSKYHRTSATTWLGMAIGIAYVTAMIVGVSTSD